MIGNHIIDGVSIAGTAFPDLGTEADHGSNQVSDNGKYHIDDNRTGPTAPISAIGNWWGQAPPDESQFISRSSSFSAALQGLIDYTSWLESSPSDPVAAIFPSEEFTVDLTVGNITDPNLESEMSMPAAAVTSIPSRPVAQRVEHAGERWGLFIGIEDYQDSRVTDLRYSVDDVHRITQILRDPQRGAFQHLKVLTSGRTNSQDTPTRVNMLRALNSWLSQAKPEDTVLFFFSGHGATDDKNRNYLLPVDVQADLLEDTAIPMRRINEILNDRDRIAAKKVIVVLDSCHSGAKVGQKAFSVEGKILDPLFTETEGRITFASCGRDEIVYEEETLGHGVFSYYLADGLQGSGDRKKRRRIYRSR